MIYPEFLKKNDNIAITAPSDGNRKETDFNRLNNGIKNLKDMGFQVLEGALICNSIKGRSGDGKARAEELEAFIKDKDVRWIIGAKGGDFLMEMLSCFDFDIIRKHPVWYQGYSDNTGLTFTITTLCDIATVYGGNFNDFGMKDWHECLTNNLKIISGENIVQNSFDLYEDGYYDQPTGYQPTGLESYVLTKPVVLKQAWGEEGVPLTGRLLGGCLDVLLNLCGTRFDQTAAFVEKYKEDGILWYLESYSLNSDSLMRGLWQLKEAGWFKYAKGFIFGRPAFYEENYGITYEEAVTSVLKDIPVILEADIGHKAPSFTVINGSIGTFGYQDGKGKLIMEYQ
jgi:muramoyltetrapeptide carboxypeptidase LdcA involved in peptidoglycan recycling